MSWAQIMLCRRAIAQRRDGKPSWVTCRHDVCLIPADCSTACMPTVYLPKCRPGSSCGVFVDDAAVDRKRVESVRGNVRRFSTLPACAGRSPGGRRGPNARAFAAPWFRVPGLRNSGSRSATRSTDSRGFVHSVNGNNELRPDMFVGGCRIPADLFGKALRQGKAEATAVGWAFGADDGPGAGVVAGDVDDQVSVGAQQCDDGRRFATSPTPSPASS